MKNFKTAIWFYSVCLFFLFLISCNHADKKNVADIITDPLKMDGHVSDNIKLALQSDMINSGKLDDSTQMELPQGVKEFYSTVSYRPIWSSTKKWLPQADSLFSFIMSAELEGLFPNDYHSNDLKKLKDTLDADSVTRMNAAYWARADLLFTDGFMHLVKDLKQGRLQHDSLSLNKDSIIANDFFVTTLNNLLDKKQLTTLLISLQPKHKGYWDLKQGIKLFVDSMDKKKYTQVSFPFKRGDTNDSIYFIKNLQKRLLEANCIDSTESLPDSIQLFRAIKKYQVQHQLLADGKYGKNLIYSLNNNDVDKFKRIALTLDKYKQLPEKMPEKYIWVNIPAYNLYLIDADTVVFESKVICGKPETPTPLLTAEISNIITYPTWTVPNSIIIKQYLPRLKNNAKYISNIGLKLLNNKGEIIDPTTVNWSKYSKGIPYKIMQESGDNNSLGLIKFNFENPYYVYLHDTNQRYLFKNSSRALSHGCVRVQEWEKLAYYIAGNDSINSNTKASLKYTADSIKYWVQKKERHWIDIKNHIPLYIRYFTCEGIKGKIKFYEDIYAEDKQMIEKYFEHK